MALNICRDEAEQVSVPVPSGTESGDVVLIGDLPAVALVDRGAQTVDEATVKFDGSIYADVTIAVALGDAIYAHGQGDSQTFNKTSSGGRRAGISLSVVGSGGGRIEVKLAK